MADLNIGTNPLDIELSTPEVKLVERCPSNWSITSVEDDLIVAEAFGSKERFEGTIAEFNAALRA
jgi:hypothetical protein